MGSTAVYTVPTQEILQSNPTVEQCAVIIIIGVEYNFASLHFYSSIGWESPGHQTEPRQLDIQKVIDNHITRVPGSGFETIINVLASREDVDITIMPLKILKTRLVMERREGFVI
ncbi:uncharacterized protein PHALS_07566 [Plasmopara halstedii]|uniref:Uncharacterized protein n=1 Tax=Plasmopara halstedii TaxID=4781 RepID=A0A0P1B6T5_PLAHL|nr:uncharacterized protein PHALS_07566 [Plasmopara halstedii]CEG49824.1 hypothetical protein PHALS_07566 [Plasmopara halstedii]|eukprot:XP_024586193.1 hypothetical protein PHALS_07566 [Plasmopara halstedii]